MRSLRKALYPSLGVVAVALLPVACGGIDGRDATGSTGDLPASAESFTELMTGDVAVDYEVLDDPEEAYEVADLIVTGTVTEVLDGVRFDHERFHDPAYQEANAMSLEELRQTDTFITLVVEVDEVLAGTTPDSGLVYLRQQVYRDGTDAGQVADIAKGLRLVAVAVDVTRWQPYPDIEDTQTIRPEGIPTDAPLFEGMPDGLWFQAETDPHMYGLLANPGEITPGWGADIDTIDEYTAALRLAA